MKPFIALILTVGFCLPLLANDEVLQVKTGRTSFELLQADGQTRLTKPQLSFISALDATLETRFLCKDGLYPVDLKSGRYIMAVNGQKLSVIDVADNAKLEVIKVILPNDRSLMVGGHEVYRESNAGESTYITGHGEHVGVERHGGSIHSSSSHSGGSIHSSSSHSGSSIHSGSSTYGGGSTIGYTRNQGSASTHTHPDGTSHSHDAGSGIIRSVETYTSGSGTTGETTYSSGATGTVIGPYTPGDHLSHTPYHPLTTHIQSTRRSVQTVQREKTYVNEHTHEAVRNYVEAYTPVVEVPAPPPIVEVPVPVDEVVELNQTSGKKKKFSSLLLLAAGIVGAILIVDELDDDDDGDSTPAPAAPEAAVAAVTTSGGAAPAAVVAAPEIVTRSVYRTVTRVITRTVAPPVSP